MTRWKFAVGLLGLLAAAPAPAADLLRPAPLGRFLATCEDLGRSASPKAAGAIRSRPRRAAGPSAGAR